MAAQTPGDAYDPHAPRRRSHVDRGRDGLTGLYSRAFLDRLLELEVLRRQQRRPLAAVALAVDDVEAASPRGDRRLADAALRSLATVLADASRPADLTFRFDDDQLLALLPSTTLLGAWMRADDLGRAFRALWAEPARGERALTISAGVVSFAAEELSPEMIGLARAALDLARREGADQVRTWDWVELGTALDAAVRESTDPEARLRALLDRCAYLLGPTQRRDLTSHSVQVSRLAARLSNSLGLSGVETEQARLAGLLHDLGKAVIPEELLARDCSLSHQEWALMRRHAEIGASTALRLGVGELTARAIREQHVRFDAGADQPLTTRILAVADAMAAMTSTSLYREQLPRRAALAELARGSGTQFDPRVVAAAYRDDVPLDAGIAA